ncbi:MAG: LON peptidase substrate-binding domain-containing protein, partial [Candidatus Zixiibacteriota bacterium]
MKLQYGDEEIEVGSVLPIIPLRDVVIFPHMVYPLLVGRPFTIAALQEAMVLDKQIFLCAQKIPDVDMPTQDDLYQIGVVSRVLQLMKLPNGTMKVLVEGLVRAKIDTFNKTKGFFTTHVEFVPPVIDLDRETEALSRTVRELFSEYVHLNRRIPDEVLLSFSGIEDYQRLADTVTAHILLKMHTKQLVLELDSVKKQFRELSRILRSEIEILRIEQKIDGTVRDALSKDQKEFYLQKQLKAIKEELGQSEDISNEVEDLYEKLEKLDASEEVLAKAEEELKKLSKMHPYSAESAVVRGYVEWLLALPWRIYTQDRSNFREVKSILDGDHYGLDKAKKRILEHLAVLRVAGKVRGPILCFVG